MNKLIFLTIFFFSIAAFANEGDIPKIDIDCDGQNDDFNLSINESEFKITITVTSSNTTSSLEFGLAQPSRHDAICASTPIFSSVESDTIDMHIDMFGSKIEGYKYSPKCSDLFIEGGECDSITVFYNHKTGALNWLRL